MPRFYFYIGDERVLDDDEEGLLLDSVETARDYALQLAEHLHAGSPAKPDEPWRVIVADEDGAPLFAVSSDDMLVRPTLH